MGYINEILYDAKTLFILFCFIWRGKSIAKAGASMQICYFMIARRHEAAVDNRGPGQKKAVRALRRTASKSRYRACLLRGQRFDIIDDTKPCVKVLLLGCHKGNYAILIEFKVDDI